MTYRNAKREEGKPCVLLMVREKKDSGTVLGISLENIDLQRSPRPTELLLKINDGLVCLSDQQQRSESGIL